MMTTIVFTDGVTFDTRGSLRIERRSDGRYVVGEGMLIPIDSEAEGARAHCELPERFETGAGPMTTRPAVIIAMCMALAACSDQPAVKGPLPNYCFDISKPQVPELPPDTDSATICGATYPAVCEEARAWYQREGLVVGPCELQQP
jgi:hypothetical protein